MYACEVLYFVARSPLSGVLYGWKRSFIGLKPVACILAASVCHAWSPVLLNLIARVLRIPPSVVAVYLGGL